MARYNLFQRRYTYPYNLTLGNLGGGFFTKSEILSELNLNSSDVKSYRDDGTDLFMQVNKQTSLSGFATRRTGSLTALSDAIGARITKFIDDGDNFSLFSTGNSNFFLSNIRELQITRANTIAVEALSNLTLCTKIRIPNVTRIETSGLSNLASGTGVGVDFSSPDSSIGELTSVAGNAFSSSKINFAKEYPLVTNNQLDNFLFNKTNTLFPFPNIPNIGTQYLRENYKLEGTLTLNNVTGTFDGRITFFKCEKLEKILIPNCIGIVGSNIQNTWYDCDLLNELDLRSCSRIDNQTSVLMRGMNRANLVVHAHIDQKTSNSGSPNATFQWVIDGGGTVNWYNANGTLNSTN